MLSKPLYTLNGVKIYGNNQERQLISWYDLSEKEKKEFDYLDSEEKQADFTGFRYKGNVYDLGEFTPCHRNMFGYENRHKFDGYLNDSFFSGILIKFSEWGDSVKVYTFIS